MCCEHGYRHLAASLAEPAKLDGHRRYRAVRRRYARCRWHSLGVSLKLTTRSKQPVASLAELRVVMADGREELHPLRGRPLFREQQREMRHHQSLRSLSRANSEHLSPKRAGTKLRHQLGVARLGAWANRDLFENRERMIHAGPPQRLAVSQGSSSQSAQQRRLDLPRHGERALPQRRPPRATALLLTPTFATAPLAPRTPSRSCRRKSGGCRGRNQRRQGRRTRCDGARHRRAGHSREARPRAATP